MKTTRKLTQDDLKNFKYKFTYNHITGDITRIRNLHNNPIRKLNTTKKGNGYICISLNRTSYLAHRIAWFLYYGKDAEGIIDHINGKRNDNRICNLQIISNSANIFKGNIRNTNKSGCPGVFYNKQTKKYEVFIFKDRKKIHIARVDNYQEAFKLRKQAELDYFGFNTLS